MKKFEYKRIYHEVGYRELDMIGEAGWELVAVEPSKTDTPPTLCFLGIFRINPYYWFCISFF